MRYFLQKEFEASFIKRRNFLYDISNLYWVPETNNSDFLCLKSFPYNINDDICIVYGHNNKTYELIKNSGIIYEKNVYIIACAINYREKYKKIDKNVYFSPQDESDTLAPYIGDEFGFDFDITDVELNLYNCREKDFRQKLNLCFELLKEEKNERLS